MFTPAHHQPLFYPGQYSHIADTGTRASFAGQRITLRQVSPESEPIFDFIISLHKSCNGDWKALGQKAGITEEDLTFFLHWAAQFLGNR